MVKPKRLVHVLICLGVALAMLVGLERPAHAQGSSRGGVSVEAATQAQNQGATAAYTTGMASFRDGKFEEALQAFQVSYGIVASPNSHFMVVRSLAALGRNADAYREAEATVKEASERQDVAKYAKTSEAARKEMLELEKRVGRVTVQVSGATATSRLMISGTEVPREDWGRTVVLDPGTHTVLLMTESHSESREVFVAAGKSAMVEISPFTPQAQPVTPVPKSTRPKSRPFVDLDDGRQAAGLAFIGVGAAGMVVWGVFGGLTSSKFSSLESGCTGGVCPAELQGDLDDGKTFQVVANVGAIVGAVGLTTGLGLFVWGKADGPSGDSAASGATTRVSVGPGSVSLTGSF